MRRFRILVNPLSGGGSAPAAVERVERLLVAAGAGVSVEHSKSAEQSQAAVADAVARGEIVVAAGGDGMLASIAGAVVAANGQLGIIPSGRGNDFARMLGLSDEPADPSQRPRSSRRVLACLDRQAGRPVTQLIGVLPWCRHARSSSVA